jgi:hypothetical protein
MIDKLKLIPGKFRSYISSICKNVHVDTIHIHEYLQNSLLNGFRYPVQLKILLKPEQKDELYNLSLSILEKNLKRGSNNPLGRYKAKTNKRKRKEISCDLTDDQKRVLNEYINQIYHHFPYHIMDKFVILLRQYAQDEIRPAFFKRKFLQYGYYYHDIVGYRDALSLKFVYSDSWEKNLMDIREKKTRHVEALVHLLSNLEITVKTELSHEKKIDDIIVDALKEQKKLQHQSYLNVISVPEDYEGGIKNYGLPKDIPLLDSSQIAESIEALSHSSSIQETYAALNGLNDINDNYFEQFKDTTTNEYKRHANLVSVFEETEKRPLKKNQKTLNNVNPTNVMTETATNEEFKHILSNDTDDQKDSPTELRTMEKNDKGTRRFTYRHRANIFMRCHIPNEGENNSVAPM